MKATPTLVSVVVSLPLALALGPITGSARAADGQAQGDDMSATAAARAEAWVDMLNGVLTIGQMYDGHFSPAFHEKMPRQRAELIFGVLRRFYDGAEAKLEESIVTDQAITLRLSNSEHRWAEYELQFQPGDRQLLLGGFNARILGPRPTPDWEGLTLDELIDKIGRHLDGLGKDEFSGTVLIARGDSVLLEKSFGTRTPGSTDRNTSATGFPIASVSKVISALAVAVLVDRGALDPGAPIGRYLPELPNSKLREQVTVEQLLMHTSGVSGMLMADDLPGGSADLKELAFAVARQPLNETTGRTYRYSNGGTILLGYLVERIGGQPYADFVRKNVFEPAGMRNSGFLYRNHYPQSVAVGEFDGPSGRQATTTEEFDSPVNPSNSVYSTARDLFRLNQALFRAAVFDNDILEIVTADSVTIAPDTDHTTGLMRRRLGARTALGHTGGMPGISAQWWYVPELELSVIALSNRSNQAADVAEHILSGIGGLTVDQAVTR